MTKTGATKEKIYNLLCIKKMTVTELGREIHRSPSVVAGHMKWLIRGNFVVQVPPSNGVRRWKYYIAIKQPKKVMVSIQGHHKAFI